ncbi:MAG: PadR family transcriptional regulator [Comamonadaceae bacterium]|jgi:DNA-binding PadR family transcriptional regulator|nr:MAG: PadR family transcriptional regulator [Comamonadaceae bacterium]
MSLRLALLALLTARPMTGFDVMGQFDESVGYLWHAPHTQIYPELRKLEALGLVEGVEVARGERGKKRIYSITDLGKTQLRDWMNEVDEPRRDRDPYRLKAAYFEWAEPESAYAQLAAHVVHYTAAEQLYRQMHDDILARRHPLLKQRLANIPADQHEAVVRFKAFAYSGLVRRARGEVDWAREGLALLESLHPDLKLSVDTARAGDTTSTT